MISSPVLPTLSGGTFNLDLYARGQSSFECGQEEICVALRTLAAVSVSAF
jgi:hypothetical protein